MINYYHIRLHEGAADLVDTRDGRQWHFVGGYDPDERLVTQLGCDLIATWLGERSTYDGTLLAALDEAQK